MAATNLANFKFRHSQLQVTQFKVVIQHLPTLHSTIFLPDGPLGHRVSEDEARLYVDEPGMVTQWSPRIGGRRQTWSRFPDLPVGCKGRRYRD